jgi:hypothetical protein
LPEDPIPVELRPEGTIRFSVGPKRVMLKRPTLNEWRELSEARFVMQEDIADLADKVQEQSEGLADGTPAEKRASNKTRRQLLNDLRQTREGACRVWVRKCLDLLSDTEVDDDEFEAWMVTEVFVAQVSVHMQTTPLRRGES